MTRGSISELYGIVLRKGMTMREVVLTAAAILAFTAFACSGCKKPGTETAKAPTPQKQPSPPTKVAPGEKSTTLSTTEKQPTEAPATPPAEKPTGQ